MLLEFRVKNYRSIRDSQILSLVASSDKDLADTHLTPTGIRTLPQTVRSAVIYGPNASGKSNLLNALSYMRAVIIESATLIRGQTYSVQPFRLDPASVHEPTEFEITFMLNGVRHQYGFSLTSERIFDEWLLVYRKAKPQQWLTRHFNIENRETTYEFSAHLIGPRKTWQEATRPNALFLSTAVQLNSELLSPIFVWIAEGILFLGAGQQPIEEDTTALLDVDDPFKRRTVREFLSTADLGISDVKTVSRTGLRQRITFSPSGEPPQIFQEERARLVPQFAHNSVRGSVHFEFQEESHGTQRWYGLAAPILNVLDNGQLLVVDELDSSLHTLLVRRLIGMFHDNKWNKKGAQLIFSTHDTSLLDGTLFRRDQVWFTEKGADQSTVLYPLSDFSPRKKEALERGYLAGRYGGVPFFTTQSINNI